MRRQLHSSSLRKKLVFFSVVYMLGAYLVISITSILPYYNHLKKSQENSLLTTVQDKVAAIEEYLARLTDISRQVSGRTTLRKYLIAYNLGQEDKAALAELTALWLKDSLQPAEVTGITRLDKNGEMLGQVGLSIPPDLWLIPGKTDDEPLISDPQTINGNFYLLVGSPILDEKHNRIGTDIVLFSTDRLEKLVHEYTGIGICGYVEHLIALEVQGIAQYFFSCQKTDGKRFQSADTSIPYYFGLKRALNKETGIFRYKAQGDWPDTLIGFSPIAPTGWGMLVLVPEKELYAPINEELFPVGATIFSLTILGGIVMFFLLQPLTRKVMVYSTELEKLNADLQLEIAERMEAEEDLAKSERQWAATFEAITDAVAIVDKKGNILKRNQAAEEFLGESAPDPEKDKYCCFFGNKDRVKSLLFEKMVQTKEPQSDEIYLPEADRYFHFSLYPLLGSTGTLWGSVHVAKEITDQKKMERLKDELLSSVSHEMRTPLTAMMGFVEFLIENEVDRDQQIDCLQTVQKETEKLNELISNFLDLQRMQAEMETYDFKAVDVPALLEESRHLFEKASKKHQTTIDCSSGLPPVRGDVKRLQQVFKNLISNAIKYSPKGGKIILGARQEEDSVILWVSDEGLGIPQEALDKVFGRFYRVNSGAHRTPRGVGIGLALVREIVKGHGGSIWAESVMGKGSTFYIRLPIKI
ncbi:MAG: PAS domain S-box protein [Desulfuromonadaceae bacterium]|nr:PAS domain S-box protein [Desulfuromonadaceae bacterium]